MWQSRFINFYPITLLLNLDKAFKFGVSWDTIKGLNTTFVFLIHFGPLVLSVSKITHIKKHSLIY